MDDGGRDRGVFRELEDEAQRGFVVFAAEVREKDVVAVVDGDGGDNAHIAGAEGADGPGESETGFLAATLAAEAVVDEDGGVASRLAECCVDELGKWAIGETACRPGDAIEFVFAHVAGFAPGEEHEVGGDIGGFVG